MGRRSGKWKAGLVNSLEIPRDLAFSESVITVTGNGQLCIENYKNIIKFNRELIIVQTVHGKVQIFGKRLKILYYTNDEMKVCGSISGLQFET